MKTPIRFLFTLLCAALACVAVAQTPPPNRKGPPAGQFSQSHGAGHFSQPHGHAVGKSTTTGYPQGVGKQNRAGTGKPITTPVPAYNATHGNGKLGVPATTPAPAATVRSTPPAVTGTPTATPLAGPQGPTGLATPTPITLPAQQLQMVSSPTPTPTQQVSIPTPNLMVSSPTPTSTPIVVHVQQPAPITDPNQPPTTTSTPLTVQVTQIPPPTAAPLTAVVPVTTMSAPAINVAPNTNTNNPTQSALSVTNQQPGTAPTGIQGQVVTGAPTSTQTRTPAPLSVTGGEQIGVAPPSNFTSVSVTNPNGTPPPSLVPTNSYRPYDTGGYMSLQNLTQQYQNAYDPTQFGSGASGLGPNFTESNK